MRILLVLSLLALAAPIVAAAPVLVPHPELEDLSAFENCFNFHFGLFLSTGNPGHLGAALACAALIPG
jgi:hypothetical protein